ncbi:Ribitol-5-phosphate xylosyltransferase 1 [Amphibalanus amphitrite]|uniref:Ribitol-5-phosphate xylosyltransferase 1 n=1 Tax=Amphibalanus amphitrite TaxID=1232801 RepID=A0A6A4X4K5_AMPAM|nr:Ribitol-5-phosphate xylosyltransferase 1 [Amphibalanus amphitrite]
MKVRISLSVLSVIFFVLYLLLTMLMASKYLVSEAKKDICGQSSPSSCTPDLGKQKAEEVLSTSVVQPSEAGYNPPEDESKHIEIWSKAAIGWYFWNSIFNARLQEKPGEPWSVGSRRFYKYTFTFRHGPGVVPNTVPADVRYLVLILNGRTDEKVRVARQWLDLLPRLVLLQHTAVVLHGSEFCNNTWIRPYLRAHGGRVDALFVVYDDPDVNGEDIFQWPLGVATYRGFPQGPYTIDFKSPRPHSCNFLGTVYANSSRETLLKSLLSVPDHSCLLKTRQQWTESETHQSASEYVDALLQSDLTLSPAGINPECYRQYEAAALGSVPVMVADEPPVGRCRPGPGLLRRHGAPFLWLRDWRHLPELLRREAALTARQRAARRRRLLAWYENFKRRVRNEFINVIVRKFFHGEDGKA